MGTAQEDALAALSSGVLLAVLVNQRWRFVPFDDPRCLELLLVEQVAGVADRRFAKTPAALRTFDARSSARPDAKPSSGNLRDAQSGAAQSIPVAERNRNR